MQKAADSELLRDFQAEVLSKVPHLSQGGMVENPTPLIDLTQVLVECAKSEYGMKLNPGVAKVYGKFESKIFGGSVKVRPAVSIIGDAIASGRLSRGQTIFEATSGNFGLALGVLRGLGLDVVALVSRKLQPGVVERLRADGVRLVDLDVEICPAPGMQGDVNLVAAKAAVASVGQQLVELGFKREPFGGVGAEAESLLARQDAINLAKLLARTYGGYCPEQYDNDLNVEVHEEVTAAEVDQQLQQLGSSLEASAVVCAFGTGGTGTGVSRYVERKYGKKGVRVVFPLAGQDVAGIRTREKAEGLRFYDPGAYLGEHEVDFEETRRLFEYFNERGYDLGESGGLVLYACMQMLNYGLGRSLVAIIADGADKYVQEVRAARRAKKDQVTLRDAAANIGGYGGVVWTHNMFVPKPEGIRAIASSLGCDESIIKVADVSDVQSVLNGSEPSEDFGKLLPAGKRPLLVVCMAGNTSLRLAKVLERTGAEAESLIRRISALPGARGMQPLELVSVASR
jgi:cysteine synthase